MPTSGGRPGGSSQSPDSRNLRPPPPVLVLVLSPLGDTGTRPQQTPLRLASLVSIGSSTSTSTPLAHPRRRDPHSRPLLNANGVAADSPGLAEERGLPGVQVPNDPRTLKAVRRIPAPSGSVLRSGSNDGATRRQYRFRPRHRRHGTKPTRSAKQLVAPTHDITPPSRIAAGFLTRCFRSGSHAASGPASILFIPPIPSAATSHRDGMPPSNPRDSQLSRPRR